MSSCPIGSPRSSDSSRHLSHPNSLSIDITSEKSSNKCNIYSQFLRLKNQKDIKIEQLYIRSVTKYIDQLIFILNETCIDILCLNEKRLSRNVLDAEINIEGYDIYRKDRNREGGGVAVYVRNYLNTNIKHELINDEIEAIFMEIKPTHNKPFLLCAVYRPPN